MTGTFVTNAQHTFAGGANINVTTSTQPIVRIGASTVGAPGSVTAGPFGTGPVNISGATSPILQPTGSDITIANAVTLNAGFFAATPASVDPTVRSLTFTGPITTVGSSRTITNNIVSGGTLTFGSAGSPSTLTLGGNLGLQTQFATSGSGGGVIVVNDQISGAFGINVQNGATVTLTNNNTNTGISNVQNSASGQAITTTLIVNNVPVNAGVDAGLGGGVAVKTGTLAGTGTIAGNSSLQENAFGPGHLAPGNGAGTANGAGKLTFYNDLTFSPGTDPCVTCTFDVEIGGLTAGTQYDQVVVGGALTLGDTTPRGTLNVSLINGFTTPTSSTDFTIMTGTSVTGTFATVNLPDANWSIVYNPTSVVLHVAAGGGLPGDFNNDGKVDAGDYVVWRRAESQSEQRDRLRYLAGQFRQSAGSRQRLAGKWFFGARTGICPARPHGTCGAGWFAPRLALKTRSLVCGDDRVSRCATRGTPTSDPRTNRVGYACRCKSHIVLLLMFVAS